jgi:hypothetical protein
MIPMEVSMGSNIVIRLELDGGPTMEVEDADDVAG